MPLRVVLDSTVLVSAFLMPGGAADAVLHLGIEEALSCCLADEIMAETVQRLMSPRLQRRYAYTADEVDTFEGALRGAFLLISDLPPLTGIVRDPNDDMVLACAIAAEASHYEDIAMVTPEAFLRLLRNGG
jgi:putative PIN family toxin of toxin-antitoxin system